MVVSLATNARTTTEHNVDTLENGHQLTTQNDLFKLAALSPPYIQPPTHTHTHARWHTKIILTKSQSVRSYT